jgi:AcrR family transcriptional regulator
VVGIAAVEFANEAIAREAGITRAYVFRLFGTKKALFAELVGPAFDRCSDGMAQAAGKARGLDALTLMGARYHESLARPDHPFAAAAGLCGLRRRRGPRSRPGLFEHSTAETSR